MTPEEAPRPVDLAHEAPFRLGPLEVRPARREIVAGSERRILEPRIMQVLVALARQKGEVVSRDDLIASCWGGRVVSEDSIDRCIGAIRRLAAEVGGFSVATIVRVGYRLVEGSAGEAEPGADARRGWRRMTRRPWLLAAAAITLVLLAAAAAWVGARRAARPGDFSDVRVAVLPFDALSPGPEAGYFAESLRGEILSALARNQVRVISRQDSLTLKGADPEPVIRRLRVGLLLNGSVERVGDTLRVRLHLDDPRDHTTLWSRAFEGTANEPVALQTRVAGNATSVISWLASNRYGLGASIDRPTLAIYLEAGDEIENQGGDRFLPLYRQVVARAPDFSYGHSGLGFALARMLSSAAPEERDTLMKQVRGEADRALQLDPHNGEGYVLLSLATPPLAWGERERVLQKGLAADPIIWSLPSAYSGLLADLGREREALAMMQRATAISPYWAGGRAKLARRLADNGRPAEARAVIAEATRLWPDDPDVHAIAFQLAIELDPAVAGLAMLDDEKRGAIALSPTASAVWRAFLQARGGHEAARRSAAAEVARAADEGALDRRAAVRVLSLLGDLDGAFAQAGRLAADDRPAQTYGFEETSSVLFTPATRAMRADPRFMATAARFGLVEHWRASGKWPDFCQEPGLPYDCRREAERLSASAR